MGILQLPSTHTGKYGGQECATLISRMQMQRWVLDTSSLFFPTPNTCSYFHPPRNIHPKSWELQSWQSRQKARAREVLGAFPVFICYRVPSISSQPSPSLTNLHKVLPLVGCLQSCGQTPARFLIPALCPRRKEETEMKTW